MDAEFYAELKCFRFWSKFGASILQILLEKPVRVKEGKSLRNGMWNGVRNRLIMRNTIYVGNKLTEERVMFSRQFYKSSSFFDAADSC